MPHVAYLVNQYPKVSHTFIRREIQALERLGWTVSRFAIRGWADPIADEADRQERERTAYVLRGGIGGLLGPLWRTFVADPGRFMQALRLAWRTSRHADRPWPYHLVYLAEACWLRAACRERGIAHLHAHFGTNSAAVAMFVEALGGPSYSFTAHGPEEFDKPAAIALGTKVERAAFVVAISSFGRSQLYRWIGGDQWPKVEVVHCGLDAAFHRDAPATGADTPPGAVPRLVCVGRICEQKAQLLLVQAVARVVRAGRPLQLVLAGDGEMRPQVEAEIARLGLGAHVRITGWIGSDQVRDEILASQALVLPSFAEGLPVVLMEAMALRRPVVTTYIAGIPELVRNGQEGWLCEAGDVDALTAALVACLDATPADRARLGEAAHQRVVERHDIDTEAAKLAVLFGRTAARGT